MVKTVAFITMSRFISIENRGIYTDLLRKFRNEGWNVYVITPHERSLGMPTELMEEEGVHILGVRTLNLQKTSILEKGLGQVLLERQFKRAIKRFLRGVVFDLILYSTPPITIAKVVAYLKSQNPEASSYLLLKDIFPQNAVDLGMMSKSGVKGLLYHYFRRKEKELYTLSDYIGCMSPSNVEYILKHNREIEENRVEVAPNSLELIHSAFSDTFDEDIVRTRYGLDLGKPVFIYGGNLGKPQAISFLIGCLDAIESRKDCNFVVIGTGTELPKLKEWYKKKKPLSVKVMDGLPKNDYDNLVRACDVGLIFLDHRFTIPNFPSRLLSYLENKMPVICATDVTSDIGRIAEDNGFGYWCESVDTDSFTALVDKMMASDIKQMGERGYEFLLNNYLIDNTYNAIISHV